MTCFWFDMIFDSQPHATSSALSAFAPAKGDHGGALSGTSSADADSAEIGFLDLLDAINPLQHIPVVSTLYREATGDDIGNPARIAGGFLFGGVLGLVGSIANAVLDETTGKDLGDHLMGLAGGDDSPGDEAGTANDLRFQRASNAYQQLGGEHRESGLDYVVEAP